VGVDAADWLAIEPLVAAGQLPAFARLLAAGRTGTLVATPPLLSPILWTTIATGRQPEDHGVLDFMVDLPAGGQAPVSVASRRVAALWNAFSDRGRRAAVVGWWATWPAEDIRGVVVSDRVAPQLLRAPGLDARSIAPPDQARLLARHLVRPEALSRDDLARYVALTSEEHAAARSSLASEGRAYRDPLAHLAAVIAATRTYGAMAEAILRSTSPDLGAVYFEAVDTVSHRYLADPTRGPQAIAAAYRDIDAWLARLAAAAAPGTWMIVCSDHGFHPADAGIAEDPAELSGPATAWHRPYGIVAAAEARQVAAGTPAVATAGGMRLTPLDVAPTVLHAAGLPVSAQLPGRVATELLPEEARGRPIARVLAFEPPRALATDGSLEAADGGALERLKALGYLGATTTSLARLNLGEALYRRGKLEAAERELRAVVEAQPQNLTAHLWLARTLRDLGRPELALRSYAAGIRLPGGSAAAIGLAEAAVAAGRPEEAARLMPRPRAPAPEAAPLHVARAVVAQSQGRAAEAETELRAALAADPASFDALSRLLDIAIAHGRPDSTLPLVRAGVRRAPRSPRLLGLLGTSLLAAGRAAEAESALAGALALAPDGDALRLELARAQLERGAAAEALATLDAAAASRERAVLRGAALSRLERWPAASQAYREALTQGPESAALLNGLAYAELRRGRRDEAARLLERSLSLDSAQPLIARLLVDVRSGRNAR
jgi:tetratricopeptide (TPR) repeat protein